MTFIKLMHPIISKITHGFFKIGGRSKNTPPWNSKELRGTPWNSKELRGTPWNSMELHGTPWNSEELQFLFIFKLFFLLFFRLRYIFQVCAFKRQSLVPH